MGERSFKLLLAYDGTRYQGWQRQAEAATIQGVLEAALARLTGEPVTVHGAGRTDSGVHALGMTAHFRTRSTIPARGLLRGANSILPADIRLLAVEEVDNAFHARYSAVSKTYCYQLSFEPVLLPTMRLYWAWFRPPADPGPMAACLAMIQGTHDFSSFEASGSRAGGEPRGAVRTIFAARLQQDAPARFRIEIRGDGFLRHMVRNIVGTVVEVGQGRRTVEDFRRLLAARDRRQAGPTAPACGLFLEAVHYGQEDAGPPPSCGAGEGRHADDDIPSTVTK